MVTAKNETRGKKMTGYVNIDDGRRIYFLPGVPMGAGTIDRDPMTIDQVLPIVTGEITDDSDGRIEDRVNKILGLYAGRILDVSAVLMYSLEKGRFDEFATRLEEGHKQFSHIPPPLMLARTDVTAFVLQMYFDLGEAGEDLPPIIEFDKKYGPGMVVNPNK